MRDSLVIATHIYGFFGSLYGSLFFLVTAWQLLVTHGKGKAKSTTKRSPS